MMIPEETSFHAGNNHGAIMLADDDEFDLLGDSAQMMYANVPKLQSVPVHKRCPNEDYNIC